MIINHKLAENRERLQQKEKRQH